MRRRKCHPGANFSAVGASDVAIESRRLVALIRDQSLDEIGRPPARLWPSTTVDPILVFPDRQQIQIVAP